MPARPRLWRAHVRTEGPAQPGLPEEVEERAQSISLFRIEDERTGEVLAWQIDLLFTELPDRAWLEGGLGTSDIEIGEVPDEDWLAAVASRTPPARAGQLWIHGSHIAAPPPPGTIPLQLDAGLAFGSGEHATTRLCLLAMQGLRRRRFRHGVLDLGCGSGILAIAAAKLWPCRVTAADHDPVAVAVAAENARINDVAGRVTTLLSEGFAAPDLRRRRPFDLVLANILADPLIELAPHLVGHLAPGGQAVLSGLLGSQSQAVARAYRARGLRPVGRLDDGPWCALVLRKPISRQ